MASLQRTISRAIAVKGLNKKQKRMKLNEIKERKRREREMERECKNADDVRVDR